MESEYKLSQNSSSYLGHYMQAKSTRRIGYTQLPSVEYSSNWKACVVFARGETKLMGKIDP